MRCRLLLLGICALLLVAFRAPLRQGKGGFMNHGLIREKLGKVGAVGKWIQSSLQDQLLGKRVHYMKEGHSWSGRIIAVIVQPITSENSGARKISVIVETMAGMGDKPKTGEAEENTTEQDYGSSATIRLDQISGIMKVAHPYVGRSIKVSYDDVRPLVLPGSPIEMFRAGEANMIVAVYSDGYLEVDVTGVALGTDPDKEIASGTVFIHIEDIWRDPGLEIVHSSDLETQPNDN